MKDVENTCFLFFWEYLVCESFSVAISHYHFFLQAEAPLFPDCSAWQTGCLVLLLNADLSNFYCLREEVFFYEVPVSFYSP